MAYLKHGDTPPAKGRGARLTPLMERFIEEFLIDMVGSKAVIRAGYKTKNPNRIATELMQHPLVKAEIEKKKAERRERMGLSADYVLTKLQNIAEETEKENPQAALRALELLGKHLGLYKDRQEISGPDGRAIEMEQRTKEDVQDFTSRLQRLSQTANSDNVIPLNRKVNGE